MKNITKHGNQNPDEIHEARCLNCGCEFTFQREDCYWYRPICEYVTTCPECGKDVWVGDIFEN